MEIAGLFISIFTQIFNQKAGFTRFMLGAHALAHTSDGY